jgi:hypothetical protein
MSAANCTGFDGAVQFAALIAPYTEGFVPSLCVTT